jgi:thiosulfate/3-mercaptopyruvate sulfurtransferase
MTPRPFPSLLRFGACALALSASTASAVAAQPSATVTESSAAARSMLTTVAQLDARRAGENVVILQVGTPAQFDSAHVPGARPVALTEISTPRTPGSLTLELPDSPTLERWARSAGISSNSRIVVVPSGEELQSSTRVFLTLAFMGLGDRTTLLDGGLLAWRAAGKPVETGPAPERAPSTAPLTITRDSSIIAIITDVDAATRDAGTAIVDARLTRFYEGNGGGYPRPGHVPTAVNIPISVVADGGMFKSDNELRALFTAAGVKPGDKVITYCHIGQQATLLWFVARRLGYDARMFDGSFQQWSGSERPLVAPAP